MALRTAAERRGKQSCEQVRHHVLAFIAPVTGLAVTEQRPHLVPPGRLTGQGRSRQSYEQG